MEYGLSNTNGSEFEDDDDDIRRLTEPIKDHCPKCLSASLEPYTTKNRQNVIRCKDCLSLICPRCKDQLLQSHIAGNTQKILECKRCGMIL
jgi:hypothetical protein